MKRRLIMAGLSMAAILLGSPQEASAQLNKLLMKAKDNACRIENAINNSQKRQEAEVEMRRIEGELKQKLLEIRK